MPKYEMNRKNFALIVLGFPSAIIILAWLSEYILPAQESRTAGFENAAIVISFVITSIFLCIMAISILRRLENIGKSKLWFFGFGVPLLNLYVLAMLWSYPPNVKETGIDKKGYLIFVLVLLIAIPLMVFRFVIGALDSQISDSVQITAPIKTPIEGWGSFEGDDAEIVISRCAGLFDVFHDIATEYTPPGEEYDGGHQEYLEAVISFSADQVTAREKAILYHNEYANRVRENAEANPEGEVLENDELLLTDWRQCQALVDLLLYESSGFTSAARAAERGDADAQFSLGVMYHNGQGVPQDYMQAVSWYRKAAEQGHADGQYILALMYSEGEGVPQDYKQAVSWYRKAAEQGDARAQYNLGLIYSNGEGVPQDYVQAHKWFDLAAFFGNEVAAGNRDSVEALMTPAQIAEAQKLASEWKPTTN